MTTEDPKFFAVVGETDCWDVSSRAADATTPSALLILVDSTLRETRTAVGTTLTLANIGGTLSHVPSSQSVYAEFLARTNSGTNVGIVPDDYAIASWTVGGWGKAFGSGSVFQNATVLHAGAVVAVDDVIGIELFNDGTADKVQFWLNGVKEGSAYTITAGKAWRLAARHYDDATVRGVYMRVDAAELSYLPAGAQPWGAVARVADRGGVSPSAGIFDFSADANLVIDAFKKTVSDAAAGALARIAAVKDSAPDYSKKSGFLYLEFIVEVLPGGSQYLGLEFRSLCIAGRALPTKFSYTPAGATTIDGTITAGKPNVNFVGSRIGILWQPTTAKAWFILNGSTLTGGADPEAGTGADSTTCSGDLVPAATPRGGRVRVCTHAREQLYRPRYAEAWDGADLLPEQHYSGVIQDNGAPMITKRISFTPWANRRDRKQAIGSLALMNAEGRFDVLSEYNLRNQPIIGYRIRKDGSSVRLFTGVFDGEQDSSFYTKEVIIADVLAKLDVRIESPIFALGTPELIDVSPRLGSTNIFDVCQLTTNSWDVYNSAIIEYDWIRSDTADYSGYERTDNVFGKQAVRRLGVYYDPSAVSVANADFSSWSGAPPVPDNWTVDLFSSGSVTQDSGRLHLYANAGQIAGIYQSISVVEGRRYIVTVDIDAESNTDDEADLKVFLDLADFGVVVAGQGITTPQSYSIAINWSGATGTADLRLLAFGGASGAASYFINEISVQEVKRTDTVETALTYLIEEIAGLSASEWNYNDPPGGYTPPLIGYWSDQRPSVQDVIDEICESVLMDYYTDENGVIQFVHMCPPDLISTSSADYIGEIREEDLLMSEEEGGRLPSRTDDYAPNLSSIAEYQRNYAIHDDGDVADTATAEVRTYFTSKGRENKLDTSSVPSSSYVGPFHPFYNFANNARAMPRIAVGDLVDTNIHGSGSVTVDNRLVMLHANYSKKRGFLDRAAGIDLLDVMNLQPGKVIKQTLGRWGYSEGKQEQIVSIALRPITEKIDIVTVG